MALPLPNPLDWNPGLNNAYLSLASIYQSLPGDPASTIPWYVRLLEHPSSPLALAGAVDLAGHDCIHILLGRGLLQQDEAFVLGFTMGRSGCCPAWQAALFRWCARHVYRGPYRFGPVDCEVYDFALAAARRLPGPAVHGVDVRAWLERPVGELRVALGIEPEQLRSLYAAEAQRWPHTLASARLRAAHGEAHASRAIQFAFPQPGHHPRDGGAQVAAIGREG
jgi:hypothetical protein